MISTGFVLEPEFIEEDFISSFEGVLSRATYSPWQLQISRISQDDEFRLGYDGVLTSLVPFYIQFKRASFFRPQFSGKIATQRVMKSLPTNHGFFAFSLHKDKRSRHYLQHNAMFKLSQHQRAAYLSPIFYKKQQLSDFKRLALTHPWSYHDIHVHDPIAADALVSRKSRAFRHCMTIPPHRLVNDREPSHFYSYDRSRNVCFHSDPEVPEQPAVSFYEFVDYIERAVLAGRDEISPARRLLKLLPELYDADWESRAFRTVVKTYLLELDMYPNERSPAVQKWVFDNLEDAEILLLIERMLLTDFNIVQYVAKRTE
jgi:hypothetical protein